MRGTELLSKMELVNAAFVQAADQPPAGKRRGRIRWLAVAACFCFIAVAALALWRGSTPAQHAPALEKLRIPDLVPGGMGFEGYLYYRAAELENGNPWHEGMALSSLPVYRNAAYDASGLGIAKGLDEAQMRALLDAAVSALGAAVRSVETVTAEGADTVTELRAATDRGELRAQADGTLVYLLPDGGLALPAGYSFTVSGTTDDAARETFAYLAERYSALLRMTAPVPVTGGDYNIYGEYRRTYAVYDAGETDAEGIANYNLCSASFVPTEDGRLGSIRIRNALAAAETLGDYPIVSADDAPAAAARGQLPDQRALRAAGGRRHCRSGAGVPHREPRAAAAPLLPLLRAPAGHGYGIRRRTAALWRILRPCHRGRVSGKHACL